MLSDGLKVLKYSVSKIWNMQKSYLFLRLALALSGVCESFWGIFMLRFLVNDVVEGRLQSRILVDVLLLAGGEFLFKSIDSVLNWISSSTYVRLCDKFSIRSLEKKMNLQYALLENPDMLDKITNLWRTDGVVSNTIEQLCFFISGIFIFVGSLSILSTLNIWIVFLFAGITVLNSIVTRREVRTINEIDMEKTPFQRRKNYYIAQSIGAEEGKDVRIFQLKQYYMSKLKGVNETLFLFEKKKAKERLKSESAAEFLNTVQTFVLYGYVISKYISKSIVIADFFMYLSTIEKLGTSFGNMVTAFQKIAAQKAHLDKLESYLALPDETGGSVKGEPTKLDQQNRAVFEIELKEVYFRYPNSENYVLENVNLTISNNEKISIVGENGAGKSTLIKLLCRLYEPTKGMITLNKRNIKEYAYLEYLDYISPVFQDFQLIPFRIRDNLQLDRELASKFMDECMYKADGKIKIDSLEKGLDTYIGKGTGYNGIDLSGGEKQKIAIGRMYAKDAPILIFDEATSAVDPISESTIFQHMNDAAESHTVIFISHRMSNAKLSDKIVVIANHHIEECGKHEELMEKEGIYAGLFRMQEQFYVGR